MLSKEKHGRLEEIGLSFATLDRTTTSSQIMISTPIDIAATAAARHPFAQAALGQSDWSATSTRYNGRHRSTRTAGSLSRRRDQNWRTSKWEEGQWLTT